MTRNALPVLLAAVVLLSAVGPIAGVAATDGDSPSAELDADVVEVTAGETAEIPIVLSGTDSAVVKIGSENVNYVATVVVHDEKDDGRVTLQYNTSKAGHGGAFSVPDYTNSDDDGVTVRNETEFDPDHLLATGSYPITVYAGSNVSEGNETDVGTLAVESSEEPSTTETTTVGPYAGYTDDIENGVVVAAARNQTITGELDVSPGTEVVVEARAGGTFLKTTAVNVTDDGRFRATFDFDGVPNGTEFQILIRVDDQRVAEVDGVLRTPPTTTTPTTTTEQAMQDESTTEMTPSSNGGTIPGFGLATGVLALGAVVLLARQQS